MEVFAPFYGTGGTWNIEGMENMTTEEYYAAINKRNADIKAARKGLSGPNEADNYLSSLSKRKS